MGYIRSDTVQRNHVQSDEWWSSMKSNSILASAPNGAKSAESGVLLRVAR